MYDGGAGIHAFKRLASSCPRQAFDSGRRGDLAVKP